MVIEQAIRVILLTTAAFMVAVSIAPMWFRILVRYRFGKQIRTSDATPVFSKLHVKKTGTPTGGGVIIWATVLFLAVVLWLAGFFFDGFWSRLNFINRAETYLPIAALVLAALLGLIDDWFGVLGKGGAKGGGLQVRHKIIIYAVVAAIAAWWFYVKLGRNTLAVPLLGLIIPGASFITIGGWYIPLFMLIIIASAFSANETDGLDGLLGGVSLFAFVALTTVAFVSHLYDLAAFGGVMIGSLLAFLWYNIYPAKFIMGDTGSMSLGITIGVIAMLTNTPLLLPFFAIILVVESLSVIIQLISKKVRKKKVFLSTPIHHHFEALGWPESQVTMRFWIISAVFSGLGLVIFFLARTV